MPTHPPTRPRPSSLRSSWAGGEERWSLPANAELSQRSKQTSAPRSTPCASYPTPPRPCSRLRGSLGQFRQTGGTHGITSWSSTPSSSRGPLRVPRARLGPPGFPRVSAWSVACSASLARPFPPGKGHRLSVRRPPWRGEERGGQATLNERLRERLREGGRRTNGREVWTDRRWAEQASGGRTCSGTAE